MGAWLLAQAQAAGPFVAVFCLGVAVILWKQLLFERKEHRTAEQNFTVAATKMAVSVGKLAAAVERPRRRTRRSRS